MLPIPTNTWRCSFKIIRFDHILRVQIIERQCRSKGSKINIELRKLRWVLCGVELRKHLLMVEIDYIRDVMRCIAADAREPLKLCYSLHVAESGNKDQGYNFDNPAPVVLASQRQTLRVEGFADKISFTSIGITGHFERHMRFSSP